MNFNLNQLQELIGQAKQQYDAIKKKMSEISVEATAGAGMVTVRMNGDKALLDVKIDPSVLRDDPDMLPDLIRAAVNDAGRRVDERLRSELGALSGFNLPGMF